MRSNKNLLQKQMDLKVKKSTENMSKEEIAKALEMALPVPKENDNVGIEETKETIAENLDDFIN